MRARGAAARWLRGHQVGRGVAAPPSSSSSFLALAGPRARRSGKRVERARPSVSRPPLAPGRPSGLNYPGEWRGWRGERPPSSFPAPARTFRRGSPSPGRFVRSHPAGDAEPGGCALRPKKEAPGRSSPHLTCIRRGPRRPSPSARAGCGRAGADRAGQGGYVGTWSRGPASHSFLMSGFLETARPEWRAHRSHSSLDWLCPGAQERDRGG